MSQSKAIIIGAGIGGIATAIRLTVKGYKVDVFEANSYPGGKLSQFSKDGFRFDAGPSLFTMPQYVDELFTLAGKNAADYFTYKKLDTLCHYFYPDGTSIKAPADPEKLIDELADKTGEAKDHIKRHVKNSRLIYRLTAPVFLQKSLHRMRSYLNWRTIRSMLQLFRIDGLRTMHQANNNFFNDKRLVQYFNRYATYNGSNPYKAPATLNVIPHLEQHYGAYFPDGGMFSITQSLVKLAEDLGVRFHYNTPVNSIIVDRNKATGVETAIDTFTADTIVSNMDVWFTYKKLLTDYPAIHPEKTLKQERSSSALIFYWGIKTHFDVLDLHNIFFSADYEEEFNCIWKKQTISSDPTVYLNITSKHNPDDAPAGCENWFVMINVPSNSGQDWDQLIAEARQNVIKKLSAQLGIDISQLIITESVLDPRGMEQRTSSYKGSIYGSSSNNAMAAFVRHANRSSKLKNLYFCGGSVHPGGGIPLALLSAKIVADWVD